MAYQNPIPSFEDEPQSRNVILSFTFENPVTQQEAVENIMEFLRNNRIPEKAVRLVGDVSIRYKNPPRNCQSRPYESK